jgi:hypothetical protein
MSYPVSAAWSHHVLSLCCTGHGPSRDVVLSGYITVVVMSRSGQLSRRCTVSACTSAVASITHECALKTREPSCVSRTTKSFLYFCVPQLTGGHGTRGSTGAPLSGRQSLEPWDTWQHRSSHLRKAEPRAMEHVAAPELFSEEGRAPSRGTRDTTVAPLSGRQSSEPWDSDSAGAHLSKKVRSGTV